LTPPAALITIWAGAAKLGVRRDLADEQLKKTAAKAAWGMARALLSLNLIVRHQRTGRVRCVVAISQSWLPQALSELSLRPQLPAPKPPSTGR
jgi:hypothetical protein